METTLHQNQQTFSVKNPFIGNAASQTESYVKETEQTHKGHAIIYFVWTYVAIFLSIMAIVMVEEKFFIK